MIQRRKRFAASARSRRGSSHARRRTPRCQEERETVASNDTILLIMLCYTVSTMLYDTACMSLHCIVLYHVIVHCTTVDYKTRRCICRKEELSSTLHLSFQPSFLLEHTAKHGQRRTWRMHEHTYRQQPHHHRHYLCQLHPSSTT